MCEFDRRYWNRKNPTKNLDLYDGSTVTLLSSVVNNYAQSGDDDDEKVMEEEEDDGDIFIDCVNTLSLFKTQKNYHLKELNTTCHEY